MSKHGELDPDCRFCPSVNLMLTRFLKCGADSIVNVVLNRAQYTGNPCRASRATATTQIHTHIRVMGLPQRHRIRASTASSSSRLMSRWRRSKNISGSSSSCSSSSSSSSSVR